MNGKRYSESKARKNGFYLALAVCLVAVGIAAWSTYDAVQSYTQPILNGEREESRLFNSQAEDVRRGQGEVSDTDPEAPRTASSSVKETAGSVQSQNLESKSESSKPEESKPAAESESSETSVEPVNAPMYELSDEMMFPVEEKDIVKAYSAGAPVYSETMRDWRIHTGADFKAESGSNVLACGNGLVKQTYTDNMLGNVVLIEHGDYEFFYCGLGENFQVKAGDIVTKGQIIGVVTAVPFEAAEDPHLHLEARRDSVYVDPAELLKEPE